MPALAMMVAVPPPFRGFRPVTGRSCTPSAADRTFTAALRGEANETSTGWYRHRSCCYWTPRCQVAAQHHSRYCPPAQERCQSPTRSPPDPDLTPLSQPHRPFQRHRLANSDCTECRSCASVFAGAHLRTKVHSFAAALAIWWAVRAPMLEPHPTTLLPLVVVALRR